MDYFELVTAIFDSEGNQLFETMGILSVSPSPSNTYAQHTLEDGTVVGDNKIVNQNRLALKAILSPDDYVEVYQAIKAADLASTNFTIQTRVDTYSNMYIESRPHEESSRISNTVAMVINFKEQIFTGVTTSALPASKVKNPSNADTTNSGTKQAEAETSASGSKLFQLSESISGFF